MWKRPLPENFFKSSLLERLRKAVNNAAFIVAGVDECESSSSTSHLLEEQQDRSSDLMDDLSDQSAKDSSLFSLAKDDLSVDLSPVTNHSPKTRHALSKSRQNSLCWQEPLSW